MECPRCHYSSLSVTDSRDADVDSVRRRRECDGCRFRFTTYERIEPIKLMVRKRDGSFEPYQREKICRGIERALEKRAVDPATITEIVDRVESKIHMCAEDELTSRQIGDYVIRELRDLDHVAYLRFASVYRNFDSLESFEKEMAKIKNNTPTNTRRTKVKIKK